MLSKLQTFSLKRAFSTCRFLMITSFTFNNSFVNSSNRDSNFVSKFVIFSDVATLTVAPEVSLLQSEVWLLVLYGCEVNDNFHKTVYVEFLFQT